MNLEQLLAVQYLLVHHMRSYPNECHEYKLKHMQENIEKYLEKR